MGEAVPRQSCYPPGGVPNRLDPRVCGIRALFPHGVPSTICPPAVTATSGERVASPPHEPSRCLTQARSTRDYYLSDAPLPALHARRSWHQHCTTTQAACFLACLVWYQGEQLR